jgi:hypothetical protein
MHPVTASDDLPARTARAAADAGLGERVRTYVGGDRVTPVRLLRAVGAAAGVATLCAAAVRAFLDSGWAGACWLLAVPLLVAVVAFDARVLLRGGRTYLAVHRNGVVFAGDRQPLVAAGWDEVVDVAYLPRLVQTTPAGFTVGSVRTVTVLTTRGDLRMTGRFPDLATDLVERVAARLRTDMTAQIDAGGSVELGGWSLSAAGLTVAGRLWEWTGIAGVVVTPSTLEVTRADAAVVVSVFVGDERSAAVDAAVAVMRALAQDRRG